jgi:hypothetical protein
VGAILFLFLCSFFLFSCETISVYETELVGEVVTQEGANTSGVLYVRVYYAESGEGVLAHPLGGPIFSFSVEGKGSFRQRVEVPTAGGRGLVVYAWLDRDGDGVLCVGGQREEPVGILELKEYPSHTISFQLTLGEICKGPEALYP